MAIDQTGLDLASQEALIGALNEKFGDILYVNADTWPSLAVDGWWHLADDVDGLDDTRIEAARAYFGHNAVVIGDHWDEAENAPHPEVSRRGIYVRDPILKKHKDPEYYKQTQREIFVGMTGEPFSPALNPEPVEAKDTEEVPAPEEIAAAEVVSRMKPGEIEWIGAWAVFAEGVLDGSIKYERADVPDLWDFVFNGVSPSAERYYIDRAARHARTLINDTLDLLDKRDNKIG